MCVLFYSSFVCISAYANLHSKTTIIKQNIETILIAGVPTTQAAPVYLIDGFQDPLLPIRISKYNVLPTAFPLNLFVHYARGHSSLR